MTTETQKESRTHNSGMGYATAKELFVQMALTQWNTSNQRVEKIFENLSEQQFKTAVAPNANTPSWILCHLAATNDKLFPLLGIGDSLHPQLFDMTGKNSMSKNELNNIWKNVTAELSEKFSAMNTEQWFEKHTTVSEEDFINEPHRNKLNVLLSRTNHQFHHLGQLALLK